MLFVSVPLETEGGNQRPKGARSGQSENGSPVARAGPPGPARCGTRSHARALATSQLPRRRALCRGGYAGVHPLLGSETVRLENLSVTVTYTNHRTNVLPSFCFFLKVKQPRGRGTAPTGARIFRTRKPQRLAKCHAL